MTRRCLSKRRGAPSSFVFPHQLYSCRFSPKFLSVLQNKTYNFQVHTKKDSSILICWGYRSRFNKGIRRQWAD
jgi:hypothetical protein